MTATVLRSRRATAQPYTVVSWSQHWRLIAGRWHRDAVVRLADGSLRLYAFPESVAA